MVAIAGVYDWHYDWVSGPDRDDRDIYEEAAERAEWHRARLDAHLVANGVPQEMLW